jgi:hypothetical protein
MVQSRSPYLLESSISPIQNQEFNGMQSTLPENPTAESIIIEEG